MIPGIPLRAAEQLVRSVSRRGATVFVVCFVIFVAHSARALAAPGDLDPTFGTGGKVFTNLGGFSEGHAIVVQPDGKIIAAGQVRTSNGADLAIARYNVDGSLDSSFGTGGKTTTTVGDSAIAYALALQPDGKIIAVGDVHTNTVAYFDWLIVRYNPDGSLDKSFGSAGIVITNFGAFDAATSVQIQLDGKLVVGGEADSQFGLARYDPDGKPDATFGSGGTTVNQFFAKPSQVNSLALTADERIVVAGFGFRASREAFGLARYRSDGSLDRRFGDSGNVTTNFQVCPDAEPSEDGASAIAIQSDGRIVVTGFSASPCGPDLLDFALARYEPNGALDTSFGSGGKVFTTFQVQGAGLQLFVQPDGRIIVAGSVLEMLVGYEFGIIRYNTDGTLDTSFGSGGKVRTFFGDVNFQAGSIAIGRDGKIIGLGTAVGNFVLARYETGIPIPKITNASIEGKKLIVTGVDFDSGGVILLNGMPQKTLSDSSSPGTTLIGVKAGKIVKPGDSLRVQDASGFSSPDFIFTGTLSEQPVAVQAKS
jgi:uncharacterized delta-60 repeat protein